MIAFQALEQSSNPDLPAVVEHCKRSTVCLILEDRTGKVQAWHSAGVLAMHDQHYSEIDMTNPEFSNADNLAQNGLELLADGKPVDAAREFRTAIAEDESHIVAHHGLVRALRDAGRLEEAIGAALRLTVITPDDPLAHTALSISLQAAGHVPEAEAAAARARVKEWKIALQSPQQEDHDL